MASGLALVLRATSGITSASNKQGSVFVALASFSKNSTEGLPVSSSGWFRKRPIVPCATPTNRANSRVDMSRFRISAAKKSRKVLFAIVSTLCCAVLRLFYSAPRGDRNPVGTPRGPHPAAQSAGSLSHRRGTSHSHANLPSRAGEGAGVRATPRRVVPGDVLAIINVMYVSWWVNLLRIHLTSAHVCDKRTCSLPLSAGVEGIEG